MRSVALTAECASVLNAEAVLFVRDDKTELVEFDIILNECVCADDKLCLTAFKLRLNLTLFGCRNRAREKRNIYIRALKKLKAGFVMLLC